MSALSDQDQPVKIFLHRILEDNYGIHGQIKSEDGTILCYTIERPWLDNAPMVSCIPEGVYDCIPHDSPAHPDTYEITNVPKRSAILLHTGNTESDSAGCVILGLVPTVQGVLQSAKALAFLHTILPKHFTIEIFSGD
jgi:hypothetical protein